MIVHIITIYKRECLKVRKCRQCVFHKLQSTCMTTTVIFSLYANFYTYTSWWLYYMCNYVTLLVERRGNNPFIRAA